MKRILLLTTLIAFVFSLSAQGPVVLSIHHKLGEQDYSANTAVMTNAGYEFTATRIQYYISRIEVTHDGGTVTSYDDHLLVSATEDLVYQLAGPDIGNFESISFYVGVEQSLNHLDPTIYSEEHPLAPQNPNMHWGWDPGYKFVAMEGNAGEGLIAEYQIHALGDANYYKATPEVSTYHPITSLSTTIVAIDANYINALQDIDVSAGLIEHSLTNEAVDLLKNFRDHVFGPTPNVPVSIEDIIVSNKLTIQPNPASQYATIKLDNYLGDFTMNLVDVTGKLIVTKNIQSRDETIDVSTFANGIYFVQLMESDQLIQTSKLIIAN